MFQGEKLSYGEGGRGGDLHITWVKCCCVVCGVAELHSLCTRCYTTSERFITSVGFRWTKTTDCGAKRETPLFPPRACWTAAASPCTCRCCWRSPGWSPVCCCCCWPTSKRPRPHRPTCRLCHSLSLLVNHDRTDVLCTCRGRTTRGWEDIHSPFVSSRLPKHKPLHWKHTDRSSDNKVPAKGRMSSEGVQSNDTERENVDVKFYFCPATFLDVKENTEDSGVFFSKCDFEWNDITSRRLCPWNSSLTLISRISSFFSPQMLTKSTNPIRSNWKDSACVLICNWQTIY